MSKNSQEYWIRSYCKPVPPHWTVRSRPSKFARVFTSHLKKAGVRKGKVLEIGCGSGRDALYFASNGLTVTGIDISQEALRLARANRKRTESAHLLPGRLTFKRAMAEHLPFRDRSFDGIYSIGVLHSTGLRRSLIEILRVLKPEGIADIHIWQKTIMLKTGKTIVQYEPERLEKILKALPARITSFRKDVTTGKPDIEEGGKNPHLHYALIFSLKKNATARKRRGG